LFANTFLLRGEREATQTAAEKKHVMPVSFPFQEEE
jgi:hypothetical protein